MPGLALERFESRAEAFLQARAWREHQFKTGMRPGRGLISLYETDFPDFTSKDLWDDLQAATPEDPRQRARLAWLLAAAHIEGVTRDLSARLTRIEASAVVSFEDETLAWRDVPGRWPLIAEVPRRHELEDAWRSVWGADLTPVLERWHEALRGAVTELGGDDWLEFWSGLSGPDAATAQTIAESVLNQTADVYGNGLGVFLGQLDLPIDDAWRSDVDFAFRAPRFDTPFMDRTRMPTLIRAMRDLGIELQEQTNVRLEPGWDVGSACLPLEVPSDVRL
ncbi:MAG: hypothetical protein JOZ99_06475, partial [Actinobacteria bacterium]|nr:hypothetical protein [Actinomycetota bacterium]